MLSYLLSEANARSGVEGEEYEGVWDQVLVQALVQKTVWVEFEG